MCKVKQVTNQSAQTNKSMNHLEYEQMVKAYQKNYAKMVQTQAETQYLAQLPTQADTLSLLKDCPDFATVQVLLEEVVPVLAVANKRTLTQAEHRILPLFYLFAS